MTQAYAFSNIRCSVSFLMTSLRRGIARSISRSPASTKSPAGEGHYEESPCHFWRVGDERHGAVATLAQGQGRGF